MKKITLLACCMLFLSSCMTLHKGYLSPLSNDIDESEFRYVRTVYGESQAMYFLGLGGGNKSGLVRQAKENLRSKNQLQDGQALINYTVDQQFQTLLGIITWNRVIMSADLIDRKK
jgi:hypothetical protein